MEQKTIVLKNGQVKGIYEYFAQQVQQEGKTAEFSYFVYKNAEILVEQYVKIMNTIYVEQTDTEFQKFTKENNELALKYADKDEQGNVIVENNNYKITKQETEFKRESEALQKKYEEVLKSRQQKIQESMQFFRVSILVLN